MSIRKGSQWIAPLSMCLIAMAASLVACEPAPKLPVTGEINLEFVRKDARDIYFKLKNQTSGQVSFWGVRDWWWQDVFPQVPQFECTLSNGELQEFPYPLIDGPAWKEFAIESGKAIDIVVSAFYLKDGDGRLPTGRCKFLLRLGGDVVVKSEEFEMVGAG